MLVETGFGLPCGVEEAWALLTDLERVAPALPGATVESVDARTLHATMRVKVGPVTASYRTVVSIASLDEISRTATLRASGRETRGTGGVEATVTATMTAAADATEVRLTTDLAVTGKVAQFSGGVMTDVADRLLRQFAERLESELATGSGEPIAAEPQRPGRPPALAPAEPVDVGRVAGAALLPKIAPVVAAFALGAATTLLLRRR
jgi:uncharacterized protein